MNADFILNNSFISKRIIIIFAFVTTIFTFVSYYEIFKITKEKNINSNNSNYLLDRILNLNLNMNNERTIKTNSRLLDETTNINTNINNNSTSIFDERIKPILGLTIKHYFGDWFSNDGKIFPNSAIKSNDGKIEVAFFIVSNNQSILSLSIRDGIYNDNIIRFTAWCTPTFSIDEDNIINMKFSNFKGSFRKFYFFDDLRDDALISKYNLIINQFTFSADFIQSNNNELVIIKSGELTNGNDFKVQFKFLDPNIKVILYC